MSDAARELLERLLAQADRHGRPTLPVTERYARAYFADCSLDARERIHAALRNAEQAGAVILEWGRGTAVQDLKRLRLKDPDRLAQWLGITRAGNHAEVIARSVEPLLADAPVWLSDAFAQGLKRWRRGEKALQIAHGDPDEAWTLFRIAVAVVNGEQDGLDLRRFSVRLLGDSKAVERRLNPLAKLLRNNPTWVDIDKDDELFRALGLEKFPPPVLIKGPLRLSLDGTALDLTELRPFVGLSPDRIAALQPSATIPYLLSIENLASFQRHVREIEDDAIVVYTAGFPAPALVQLLGILDRALPPACPVLHWGDRDIGGLRIFGKLAGAWSIHGLCPHLMNEPGGGAVFSADQRRRLHVCRDVEGVVGELARHWLESDLGPLEQEGIDPRSPV